MLSCIMCGTGPESLLTQGLKVNDLFIVNGVHAQQLLHPLSTAVWAVIMPMLDLVAAASLNDALCHIWHL